MSMSVLPVTNKGRAFTRRLTGPGRMPHAYTIVRQRNTIATFCEFILQCKKRSRSKPPSLNAPECLPLTPAPEEYQPHELLCEHGEHDSCNPKYFSVDSATTPHPCVAGIQSGTSF